MQSMYEKDIPGKFRFVLSKAQQTIADCCRIDSYRDFLLSQEGMILFGASSLWQTSCKHFNLISFVFPQREAIVRRDRPGV